MSAATRWPAASARGAGRHRPLFDGRPWAVTPHRRPRPPPRSRWSRRWPRCAARPSRLSPAEHDRAVARTSHVPHLLAALVAARLAGAPVDHLVLSGQGVRDVTRVAAGDPALYEPDRGRQLPRRWLALLGEVRDQLDAVIDAVGAADRAGLPTACSRRAWPGPGHPRQARRPDPADRLGVGLGPRPPGELARLFADAVASEVNIEDVHIDHDPGRPVGLVELVEEGRRRAPAGLSRSPRLDDPPVGWCWSSICRFLRGPPRDRRRRRRDLRIGQVEHVARRGGPARAALPRHRRDVPRDDLVDAAPRRRRPRPGRGRRRARGAPTSTAGLDPLATTISVDGETSPPRSAAAT